MRSFLAAVLLGAFVLVPANAEARKHKSPRGDSREVALLKRLIKQNDKLEREIASIQKQLRGNVVAVTDAVPLPQPNRNRLAVAPMPVPGALSAATLKGYEKHIAKSAMLKDLTPPLAQKVAAILSNCPGAKLTSGYRRNAVVAGSGRPSLHSRYPSRAADLAGNPSCIKGQLARWPGGLSTDYAAVRHYHVSYDPKGREWGARFAHYRGSRYARHHRRYAAVQ